MSVGRRKVEKMGLSGLIELQLADAENLPFEDNVFDAATTGFGVRNFETPEAGLAEILRVLKPGGQVVILEFSKPGSSPFKQLYRAYFKWVLPVIGRIVSKDKSAYTYLHDSVGLFPSGSQFLEVLKMVGFARVGMTPLTFGIATIYVGRKDDNFS